MFAKLIILLVILTGFSFAIADTEAKPMAEYQTVGYMGFSGIRILDDGSVVAYYETWKDKQIVEMEPPRLLLSLGEVQTKRLLSMIAEIKPGKLKKLESNKGCTMDIGAAYFVYNKNQIKPIRIGTQGCRDNVSEMLEDFSASQVIRFIRGLQIYWQLS